jgi:hypothetical protein
MFERRLPNARLTSLLAPGPVVLTFYRGGPVSVLQPAAGEESRRVLPGSFVRGQLQIRGVTGGGEGVGGGTPRVPAGNLLVGALVVETPSVPAGKYGPFSALKSTGSLPSTQCQDSPRRSRFRRRGGQPVWPPRQPSRLRTSQRSRAAGAVATGQSETPAVGRRRGQPGNGARREGHRRSQLPRRLEAGSRGPSSRRWTSSAPVRARWNGAYISPAALIEDGERRNIYRVGGDQLPVDAKGVSRIAWPTTLLLCSTASNGTTHCTSASRLRTEVATRRPDASTHALESNNASTNGAGQTTPEIRYACPRWRRYPRFPH